MQKIVFLSRASAEKLKASHGAAIISIHDISESPADLDPEFRRLTLCFHDTDGSQGGLKSFSSAMALQVLSFVEQHRASINTLYVHCQMGVSRSAAVAIMLSEVSNVPCFKDTLPVSFAAIRNWLLIFTL